jgi:hypothetical protein
VEFSISVDASGRVNGICPDDLSGGSGWARVDTDLTPQTELFDARGVALYKLVDGTAIARTPEEMDADAPKVLVSEITDAEWKDQIEAALIEVAAVAAGGI